MKTYQLLEHGDIIEDGDEIWNYIFMGWESLDGYWIGRQMDRKTAQENQPIRRPVRNYSSFMAELEKEDRARIAAAQRSFNPTGATVSK